MGIHTLDLDVAIYPDRVQVRHRGNDLFVDQHADYPFSSDSALIEHHPYLEHTIARAVGKVLARGGYSLRDPIAHVVRCNGRLRPGDKEAIRKTLREIGMNEVIFELPH